LLHFVSETLLVHLLFEPLNFLEQVVVQLFLLFVLLEHLVNLLLDRIVGCHVLSAHRKLVQSLLLVKQLVLQLDERLKADALQVASEFIVLLQQLLYVLFLDCHVTLSPHKLVLQVPQSGLVLVFQLLCLGFFQSELHPQLLQLAMQFFALHVFSCLQFFLLQL